MKNNLLPCPFCGSQAFIEEHDPEYQDPFPYRIICMNTDCPGAHVWEESEKAAIKAWNTRADESNCLSGLIKEAELQAELHPSKDARFFPKSVLEFFKADTGRMRDENYNDKI